MAFYAYNRLGISLNGILENLSLSLVLLIHDLRLPGVWLELVRVLQFGAGLRGDA